MGQNCCRCQLAGRGKKSGFQGEGGRPERQRPPACLLLCPGGAPSPHWLPLLVLLPGVGRGLIREPGCISVQLAEGGGQRSRKREPQ